MYIHMHKHTHMYMHTHTDTCTHTRIHVQAHRQMYRYTHVHTHRHTHTPKKSCSTSLFTHRARYCTLGGGREHSTVLPLLSLWSAIEQSDGSQCQRQIRPELQACKTALGDTLAPTIISTCQESENFSPNLG
ncbi:unnamed protein product, partial [Staurois parvus]